MASQFPGERPSAPPPPVPPGPDPAGLVARIRSLVVQPATEWARIDAEPVNEQSLYRRVVLPLAAIPAIALGVGLLLFPVRVLGFTYRPAAETILVQLIVTYAVSILAVFVATLVIAGAAPSFGGLQDRTQATKLFAWSAAPTWLLGVLLVVPALGGVAALLGGLLSMYLLFLGAPVLMKPARDKATSFAVVAVVIALVIGLAFNRIGSRLAAELAPATISGSLTIG